MREIDSQRNCHLLSWETPWEEAFGKQELSMFPFEMLILLDCQWK